MALSFKFQTSFHLTVFIQPYHPSLLCQILTERKLVGLLVLTVGIREEDVDGG